MSYTPEELRQIADAMDAEKNGKQVEQFCVGISTRWEPVDINGIRVVSCGDSRWIYRPKPKPVTRPWSKPEDVPGPGCWIRTRLDPSSDALIIGTDSRGVYAVRQEQGDLNTTRVGLITWNELQRGENSIDRKTWHHCTIEQQL